MITSICGLTYLDQQQLADCWLRNNPMKNTQMVLEGNKGVAL